jgi:hypothetical protein
MAATVSLASERAHAAGGGNFGGSKPPVVEAPESPAGFDTLRKPDIPVIFLSHDLGWIQFQYPPSARDRTSPLIAEADDLRAELAEDLGQTPLDGVEVRVARGLEEMRSLAPQGSPPEAPAVSIAYSKLKLIVLSLMSADGSEPAELRDGFRRELARLALAEAVTPRAIPGWLADGFVHRFSRQGEWAREWALYRASVGHRMQAVSEFDAVLEKGGSNGSLAVAQATDFVGFLMKAEKRVRFAAAIERIRQGDSLESALISTYGNGLSTLERHWRAERTRWTTLITVSMAIGAPALCFVGWSILRAVRRRRLGARHVEGKKAQRPGTASERARVHIVLSRRDDRLEAPVIAEPEIPKVEHEGEWHTLH